MTDEQKQRIDNMDYESMLSLWRSAPVGHPMFQGDTGAYYGKVMAEKRERKQKEHDAKMLEEQKDLDRKAENLALKEQEIERKTLEEKSQEEEELAELTPFDIAPCELCASYLEGIIQFITTLPKTSFRDGSYQAITGFIRQRINEIKGVEV